MSRGALNRWRRHSGNHLVEQYRLARQRARQLLENLDKTEADRFQVIMSAVDDYLLIAQPELASQTALQLVAARQKDAELRLREQQLQLKEEELAF